MGTLSTELAPHARAAVAAAADLRRRQRAGAASSRTCASGCDWDVLFVLEEDELRRAPDVEALPARAAAAPHAGHDGSRLSRRSPLPAGEGGGVLVIQAPDERQLFGAARSHRSRVLPSPAMTIDAAVGAAARRPQAAGPHRLGTRAHDDRPRADAMRRRARRRRRRRRRASRRAREVATVGAADRSARRRRATRVERVGRRVCRLADRSASPRIARIAGMSGGDRALAQRVTAGPFARPAPTRPAPRRRSPKRGSAPRAAFSDVVFFAVVGARRSAALFAAARRSRARAAARRRSPGSRSIRSSARTTARSAASKRKSRRPASCGVSSGASRPAIARRCRTRRTATSPTITRRARARRGARRRRRRRSP